ncbi:MAG: riboflavin synthase [Pyrinomonadaceae bacterium]
MFTGIIEELGEIEVLDVFDSGAKIRVKCSSSVMDTKEGDSIAVNGVCLTALEINLNSFWADVSSETLRRTTLGSLKIGTVVNLERAVTPTTRLGGHIVQGHIDARGKLLGSKVEGEFRTVSFGFPPNYRKYFIEKGSVAIEGISLTIAQLHDTEIDVAVIPKTWNKTNLSTLEIGAEVNLEVDVIAKYVENFAVAATIKTD